MSVITKSTNPSFSEAYVLEGEKIWSHVGTLSPKDKGQLEERLRRVPTGKVQVPASPAPHATPNSRLSMGSQRAESPALTSRLARPMSPAVAASNGRPASPASGRMTPSSSLPAGTAGRPKSLLPSRLGPPKARTGPSTPTATSRPASIIGKPVAHVVPEPAQPVNGHGSQPDMEGSDDMSLIISNILSHDASRSVDALKKIQKVLELSPEAGREDARYKELADHTEGLIETITLQMSHVFDQNILEPSNFRLAKHLIQTLNAFCDHPILSESLSVETLRGLLEELTLRLLITDESQESKVKDLSKFINMILLRLFATGRRITIFR